MDDSANPRYPVAGDPIPPLSPEEHEALRIEGMAHAIYDRHAATIFRREGTHVRKWGWLSETSRDSWRQLARERAEEGWDATTGFAQESTP